ncbi:helix-turn-helix domain-containing protein [Maribellus maritimus]|uniref:helix-turn-helix domain-containing protein n=1 Tax=Maribellus maritimus TaxID=2870838 RepID=UPI001EEABEA4|nr:helix-turn-helix domain-containing protein [Maribellus maritimus]MCG6187530.1 helix-turn-helix domain-containing protein [Maribellus maritimus]
MSKVLMLGFAISLLFLPDMQIIFGQKFLGVENMSAKTYQTYLDSIMSGDWETAPEKEYYQWLEDNSESILNTKNIFLRSFFWVEKAMAAEATNNDSVAYKCVNEAFTVLSKTNHPNIKLSILKIGVLLSTRGFDYFTKIHFLKKIENSGILISDSTELTDIMLQIADLYWHLHQYDHSIEYCKKALHLSGLQNYKKGKIRALLTMYTNSHFISTDKSYQFYLEEALRNALSLGDSSLIAEVYFNTGLSFYRNENQQEAIKYYQLSRSFEKERGSQSDLYTCAHLQLSYTIADSIEAVGKIADFFMRESVKQNFYSYLSNAYRGKAWYFAKTGKRDSSVFYLDKAFENRQSLPEKKNASPGFYYNLYVVADMLSDKNRGLKYLSLAHEQYVKANRESNKEQLNSIRASFDYELQEEKINNLSLQNELTKEKNTRQKIFISAVTALLILTLSFIVYMRKKYRQLRDSYKELIRKNLELDKLHSRISKTEEKVNHQKNGNGIKNEDEIYKRIKELFEKEKIYKQADISIINLAKILNTNTSYLSSIINNHFEEPFKTIVNKYRIDEARRLLGSSEYTNYSIEGIAEEVGYKSRSTFYQSFKQITGLTPTQYIENVRLLSDSNSNKDKSD